MKDAEKQHIDITRAIFFWRLDQLHQFQRYHDDARWNIAIFLALLTADRADPKHMYPARDFAIAYLASVLEHHNNAATFEKREAFIKLWKNSRYEFFTFKSSQKQIMKKEMKRLTKAWQAELDRILEGDDLGKNKSEVEMNYNAKVAKFVGTLIPGRQDQRGPNHRTPIETIENLKQQNNIRADDMNAGALLNALNVRASDYYVPKPDTKPSVKVDPPAIPMDVGILGFAVPDAAFLAAQAPQPQLSSNDWPALHFPKPPPEADSEVSHIADRSAAIRVLKESNPTAMLAKLMALFPEEAPNSELSATNAAPSSDQAFSSARIVPGPVALPTFENLGAWVAKNAENNMVDTSLSLASRPPKQTGAGKHNRDEDDVEHDVPRKRIKGEEVPDAPPARSLMLPVDEAFLRTKTTWQFSVNAPTASSGTSLFGSEDQKPRKSIFGGED